MSIAGLFAFSGILIGLFLVPSVLADEPTPGLEQASRCNSPVKIEFQGVTPHPENGPKYARIEAKVDKNCKVLYSKPLLLDKAPAIAETERPGKFQGAAKDLSSENAESPEALAATRTVEINIWEEDCCLIRVNGMRTAQTYSYGGSTVTLFSLSSLWDACCYWWHLLSGPTNSKGYTSPSQAWAKGVVKFYCNLSNPTPFCFGPIPQYQITHTAYMTLYANGYINTTGTKSTGVIVPAGKVVYTVRLY